MKDWLIFMHLFVDLKLIKEKKKEPKKKRKYLKLRES